MAAAPDDTITTKLPWGVDISLNGSFFDGIETFDALSEIAAYSGPLFVAQGSKDTTFLPANADALIAAHDGPEKLWMADMDHVFNTFGTAETLDTLVAETITYFKENDD